MTKGESPFPLVSLHASRRKQTQDARQDNFVQRGTTLLEGRQELHGNNGYHQPASHDHHLDHVHLGGQPPTPDGQVRCQGSQLGQNPPRIREDQVYDGNNGGSVYEASFKLLMTDEVSHRFDNVMSRTSKP
jgi:hypothetical protein